MIKVTLCLAIAVLASGCASPTSYVKFGDLRYAGLLHEGYTDEQIGDREHEITFEANPHTSKELITRYWHRRAQELCKSERYQAEMEVVERFEQLNKHRKVAYPIACGKVKCL